ncbi:hypothetical protein CHAB381_1260 [Campylobacter hominis ATCC BAA-381]|uniref:Uncharacterized protein n=1 Tax=Campylobacter hominis (strain ATCC BAA-381 / DSM 21671 / CCUG 45161 / LMG 19568 / NCTC 13146 / CH001A) TaxID=360107 RepID=A7I2S0_CAMHC|nr:hypothetical protein CHAB381_1260 [Campylobacter hominis ATCC BAA-381]
MKAYLAINSNLTVYYASALFFGILILKFFREVFKTQNF